MQLHWTPLNMSFMPAVEMAVSILLHLMLKVPLPVVTGCISLVHYLITGFSFCFDSTYYWMEHLSTLLFFSFF